MTIPPNALRRVLRERIAAGTMIVEARQAFVVTLLANAGVDFVIIDNEHGPFGIETIAELSRAAVLSGLTPIVRPPELTYAHITQPLDAGAQGIMLPRVTERAQVEECLQYMKYAPLGRRGTVLGRGHTGFRGGPLMDTLEAANRESFLVMQVETAEAVNRLDDLLTVPGVDAALVGPTDLSVALGVAGQLTSPTLTAAIERTIAACQRHGVVPAIHHNDVGQAARWARAGMRMVSIGSEVGHLVAGTAAAVQAVRGEEKT